VAFRRWRIERLFEDGKSGLGLDHFEVRHFRSISRHLVIACVSHLFLAEFRQKHGEKNPGSPRRVARGDLNISQLRTATRVGVIRGSKRRFRKNVALVSLTRAPAIW